MAKKFTSAQWAKIDARLAANPARYGWPERRQKSVVLSAFNIRKCGDPKKRSAGALRLLSNFIAQCDLVAVQEVQDNLDMLMRLTEMASATAGAPFEVIVSDVTGGVVGGGGMTERLAFVFRPDRITRGPVAGDISYDRSAVFGALYENREDFLAATIGYERKLRLHLESKVARLDHDLKTAKGRPPRKPKPKSVGESTFHAPHFVTFIRTPHMATFSVPVSDGKPYELSVINAHLLFGGDGSRERIERENEFNALIDWMRDRALAKRSHNPNYVLLGDLNLAFDKDDDARRQAIKDKLLGLEKLERRKAVGVVNFPFIEPRLDPITGDVRTVRTNARMTETFDQIGIIAADKRLPGFDDNATAGQNGKDGYDYQCFNFADLFAEALNGEGTLVRDMSNKDKSKFVDFFQHDVSDHMPIWMRLPT